MTWYHPNYYKKLRASRVKEAISPDDASTDEQGRTPEPSSTKLQAANVKPQAVQDARRKPQAPSSKAQASSHKHQAP